MLEAEASDKSSEPFRIRQKICQHGKGFVAVEPGSSREDASLLRKQIIYAARDAGTADATGPVAMKAGHQLIELSFCIVCALAPSALWTLDAVPAADPSIKPTQVSNRETIHGAVSAKAETRLTVNGKVIVTSVATAVMKDGGPAALVDIKVGDTVTVSVAKVADGSLQAVSVKAKNRDSTQSPSG